MATEEFHTYCPMCVAQCGVVAVVEDGRFTKVKPTPDIPTAGSASRYLPRRSSSIRQTGCSIR